MGLSWLGSSGGVAVGTGGSGDSRGCWRGPWADASPGASSSELNCAKTQPQNPYVQLSQQTHRSSTQTRTQLSPKSTN